MAKTLEGSSFPTMKATYCVALLVLLAIAIVADAATIPVQKRAPKPMNQRQRAMLASGHPVPLQGNIPKYGEYAIWFLVGMSTVLSHLSCSTSTPAVVSANAFGKFQLAPFSYSARGFTCITWAVYTPYASKSVL